MVFFKHAKSLNYDNFMDLHAKIIIFGKNREQDMFFIHLEYQPRGNCTLHKLHYRMCKCYTYVTKTRANLTTYSRKPENYNGTIIFEIDIMKNSSPINSNLGHT